MQELIFLARHIPFWAVPLLVLGAEFSYIFWLKKRKASVAMCLSISFFASLAIGFYFWAGGPDKSVKILKSLYINYLIDFL